MTGAGRVIVKMSRVRGRSAHRRLFWLKMEPEAYAEPAAAAHAVARWRIHSRCRTNSSPRKPIRGWSKVAQSQRYPGAGRSPGREGGVECTRNVVWPRERERARKPLEQRDRSLDQLPIPAFKPLEEDARRLAVHVRAGLSTARQAAYRAGTYENATTCSPGGISDAPAARPRTKPLRATAQPAHGGRWSHLWISNPANRPRDLGISKRLRI